MFSKELQELDKNTVQYMIDEMQDTIDEQKALLEEKRSLIDEQNIQLDNLNAQINSQNAQLDIRNAQLNDLKNTLNNSIPKMVSLMKQLNLPDSQIINELQVQYHLTEAQSKQYLL